jgi:hypothetical protein
MLAAIAMCGSCSLETVVARALWKLWWLVLPRQALESSTTIYPLVLSLA